MTKFLLGFTLALLLVAIVIIAFMSAPNTRPPKRSKRQPVTRDQYAANVSSLEGVG